MFQGRRQLANGSRNAAMYNDFSFYQHLVGCIVHVFYEQLEGLRKTKFFTAGGQER